MAKTDERIARLLDRRKQQDEALERERGAALAGLAAAKWKARTLQLKWVGDLGVMPETVGALNEKLKRLGVVLRMQALSPRSGQTLGGFEIRGYGPGGTGTIRLEVRPNGKVRVAGSRPVKEFELGPATAETYEDAMMDLAERLA